MFASKAARTDTPAGNNATPEPALELVELSDALSALEDALFGSDRSEPGLAHEVGDEEMYQAQSDVDMCEAVPMHGCPRSSPKKPFRLCARAFMLTFNALAFASSAPEWQAFQAWVEDRQKQFKATYWSATMEQSLHSDDRGSLFFRRAWPLVESYAKHV